MRNKDLCKLLSLDIVLFTYTEC